MQDRIIGFVPAGLAFSLAAVLLLCAGDAPAQSDEEILRTAGEASPAGTHVPRRSPQVARRAPSMLGDAEDMTAKAREQNSQKYAKPPSTFRSGSVRPLKRSLPIERLQGGHWRVRLSQGDRVLSPAVAEGRVFTGCGFGSREFHCLDAETGRTHWSVSLSDNGPSAAAYENDVLVVATESCTLYAMEPRTGRQLWSAWLGDPVLATPAVAGDLVLADYPAGPYGGMVPVAVRPGTSRRAIRGGTAGRRPPTGFVLGAFDLKTGKPRWQKWIDHHLISAPVVDGREVYATTVAGTLYKFRLSDGEILMARKCRATSAPIVAGDAIYFTRRGDDGKSSAASECITRLDRTSGQPVYSVEHCDAPYLASRAGSVGRAVSETTADAEAIPEAVRRAMDPWPESFGQTSNTIGRFDPASIQQFSGSRLLASGGNLFNCMGGQLLCVDAASGKRRWGVALGRLGHDPRRPAAAPPVVAGGSLLVATHSGQIHRVDPASGKVLGTTHAGAPVASEPVVDGGRIFVGTRHGQLVSINTGDPTLTGWSQWGGNAAHTGPVAVAGGAR